MADNTLNANQFHFELVAPEKVEISSAEDNVILPGEQGDFTVLAGHTPLLAALRPGVVSVVRGQNQTQRFFITGGFADIGNEHCIVLTPHITPVEKLSPSAIEEEISVLEEKLETISMQEERDPVYAQLENLRVKLDAAIKASV